MEPWQPDDSECQRYAQAMQGCADTAGRSENIGVSVEAAIQNVARVATGPVDITRGIDDDFSGKGTK
jgi:hypothetical protein